ncbi:phage tail tape measure protein, partial [Billgrantia azerbaijanica]
MADLEKTVAIIFEGVDQMGAGIDSATKRIDGFAGNVEDIATPMANATKAILAAEAAAGGMAVAFGVRAYDAAVKFEAAQADLAKTLGESDGSVDRFTREITELSNAYGESSTELLQSMANYKQAGFTAEESLALVKNGLDLVIAGDIEAQQASEYLVASLKGFKAPASDAGQLLEVLNASSNTYATSVDELAKGMAALSPIASTLGMGFEGTAELLIPVIEVFRSGPEAANALRTGLLRLGDDAAPVVDTLESIGVAQRDANGVLRSSSEILMDVANATSDMTASEKLFVAQQLFGIEQSSKMIEVLGSLEGSTVDVGKAMKGSASVAEEVAVRLETAEKAGDRARESFENLARTLGVQFKDDMAGIVDAVGEVFQAFEGAAADGALDGFFDELNPLLNEVERLALEVAEALPTALAEADYSGFADGLNALFGDLENVEITADDLRNVIEGLGGGFRSLSEFTAGTFEVFAGFVEVIKPVVEGFMSLDSETQNWIGVVGGISLAVSPAVSVLGTLTGAVSGLAGKGGVIAAGLPRIRDLMTLLGKNAGVAGVALIAADAISGAYQRLKEFNEEPLNLADKLKRDLEEVENIQGDEFSLFNVENLAASYESLKQYFGWGDEAAADFETLDAAAVEAAIAVGAAAGQIGGESAQKIKQLSEEAINSAKLVASAGGDIESAFSGFDTPLIDQLAALPGPLEDAVFHIVDGSADITASAEEIENAMSRVEQAFIEGRIDEDQYFHAIEALDQLEVQTEKTALSQELLADKFGQLPDSLNGVADMFTSTLAPSAEEVGKSLNKIREAFEAGDIDATQYEQLKGKLLELRDGAREAGKGQKALATETLNTEEAILKARDAVLEQELALEKLASNERIKNMEFAVDLKVAQLEADTRRVEAILSATSTTIEATAAAGASMWETLAGGDLSFSDKWDLKDHIEQQMDIQEEAAKQQAKLIAAQVKLYEARTEALKNGDGLIQIDSSGLEPALEMVMWQIIEKVQLRANAEGAEFLLGL